MCQKKDEQTLAGKHTHTGTRLEKETEYNIDMQTNR